MKAPRILVIRRPSPRTLLDYVEPRAEPTYHKVAYDLDPDLKREAKSLLNDKDVLSLFAWAFISPALALAVLLWKKYKNLRILAIPLTVISIFQFWMVWGGSLGELWRILSGFWLNN